MFFDSDFNNQIAIHVSFSSKFESCAIFDSSWKLDLLFMFDGLIALSGTFCAVGSDDSAFTVASVALTSEDHNSLPEGLKSSSLASWAFLWFGAGFSFGAIAGWANGYFFILNVLRYQMEYFWDSVDGFIELDV